MVMRFYTFAELDRVAEQAGGRGSRAASADELSQGNLQPPADDLPRAGGVGFAPANTIALAITAIA